MSRCLITFDLKIKELEDYFKNRGENPNSVNHCYITIQRVLEKHGFERIQRSVYFGYKGTTQAHGTMALQKLAFFNPWFAAPCVTDIRFLEVTDDYNAEFIIEEVVEARKLQEKRMTSLRQRLLARGLEPAEVDEIIKEEQFSIEKIPNFTQTALPKPDHEQRTDI